jgi:hypothetical protein
MAQPIDRLIAVIYRYHVDAFVREGQRNDLLHCHAVIGEQYFVIHNNLRFDTATAGGAAKPIIIQEGNGQSLNQERQLLNKKDRQDRQERQDRYVLSVLPVLPVLFIEESTRIFI